MKENLKLSLEEAEKIASSLNFEKLNGLIPAIAQDYATGRVLMLAFMNREALVKTLTTGVMHYWSRSKNRLWVKGEESGHYQYVKEVYVDCDSDALLFKVEQVGVACHTGNESCFYRKLEAGKVEEVGAPPSSVLDEVFEVILERLSKPRAGSYVASVAEKGLDHSLQKLGEEVIEFILAMKGADEKAKVSEAADVFFHAELSLALGKLHLKDVLNELVKRRR